MIIIDTCQNTGEKKKVKYTYKDITSSLTKKKNSRSLKSVQRLLCEGNWFANPKAHAGGAEDS